MESRLRTELAGEKALLRKKKDVPTLHAVRGQLVECAMITFNVVKERHGWAIRMGGRMMTPFWSKDLAIREANCLADAIRCHGECTEVIVDDAEAIELIAELGSSHSSRPDGLRRRNT